jgi:ATP-dependent RNA helicase RhlE
MGLADPLVQGILATGYTAPTEIQTQAIPSVLEGKDIIGCAQTGTGKTAAFVLPILSRIETNPQEGKKKKTRVLVVVPTRELAVQAEQAVRRYGRFMNIKTIAVYGGTPINKQIKQLRGGIEIIAATPGRLLDHINRKTIDLSNVEMLVLDEADRMLDMGFIDDIRKIVKQIPKKRQTMLFSATMPAAIKKLTKSIQRTPKMIQIGQQNNPIETITQHIYPVPKLQKMDLLLHLLVREKMDSVLVFSRTKRGADKICKKLSKSKVNAVAIHSDRTQRQRLKALEGFKSGKYRVMVATDIAARGINVEGISHVINYDIPGYPEDYIHRIGRTGRADATGDAVTFVAEDEIKNLLKIERFIERRFEPTIIDDFEYAYKVDIRSNPKGGRKKSGGRSKSGSGRGGKRKNSKKYNSSKSRGRRSKSGSPNSRRGKAKRSNKSKSKRSRRR